ncbi:MAG TPA: helix-turn-helix domain-containing protein [Roseiflexaceae bacterium]|jgi:excisionase family DNA binding protein|nr:helix-turn-helix domain-containing protein [Roseiflexaceae bacterium]
MQRHSEHDYIDGDEAATLLGVKKATLYAYVSRGVLRSFKRGMGRRRVYRRADVEALRALRPSEEAAFEQPAHEEASQSNANGDGVLRDVDLPNAETWAGDH